MQQQKDYKQNANTQNLNVVDNKKQPSKYTSAQEELSAISDTFVTGEKQKHGGEHKQAPPPQNLPTGIAYTKKDDSIITKNSQPNKQSIKESSVYRENTPSQQKTISEKIRSYRDSIQVPLAKKTKSGDPLFAAHVLEQQQMIQQKNISADKKVPTDESMEKATAQKLSVDPIVRTYESDVARALKEKKTSMVRMLMAEKKKKDGLEKEKKPQHAPKKTFLTLLSALLVVAGVFFVGWSVWYKTAKQQETMNKIPDIAPDFIFVESSKDISIDNISREEFISATRDEVLTTSIKLDTIKQIYFTKNTPIETADGVKIVQKLVSTKEFFEKIKASVPSKLIRSLENDFVFGVHMFNGNQPFLILKTPYFENSFSAMFEWEDFLAEDILPIFAYNGTSTIYKKDFEDKILKNRDLRVLYDESGNIKLLYTFVDRSTIIISTNPSTLNEIVLRLNKKKIKN